MQLDYALNRNDYTWPNALFWGNCFKHLDEANKEQNDDGARIIHGMIFAVELLPLIGQIASVFEKLIVDCSRRSDDALDLTEKNIIVDYANMRVAPLAALQPRSIADMLNRFRALPGCRLFAEDQEQVEIALNGEKLGKNDVFIPWKLHISANPENACAILGVIFGALVRCHPHFKCVRNEQLLKEYNEFVNPAFPERGRFKAGKFITIYAPDEAHLLKWASELDESIKDAIKDGRLQPNAPGVAVNHTDRPVGKTGFLWAYHDSDAGEEGVVSVVQPDIFEHDWGQVVWNPQNLRFQPVA